ncbi:MAG TPA: cytochrome c-type biogenesis protein [Spongiibacteraceae bacterium]|nr:cytochrome c-type biogenesis protein [Spongiibacteraceae bacterium]
MRYLAIFILTWLACAKVFAAIDPYQFDSEAQRERYQHFIEDMRCPKCQNQNLAGSDAPIAQDLRHELQRLLKDGKSDREITDYMVSRYGEFILYEPPFDKKTAALWLAPIAFVLVGLAVLVSVARRRAATKVATELTPAEQAKLQRLLSDNKTSSDRTGQV